MRKTKTTKKSGTIAYQLNPRYDLQGEATEKNPLMGVSVVASTPVTTREMAEPSAMPVRFIRPMWWPCSMPLAMS